MRIILFLVVALLISCKNENDIKPESKITNKEVNIASIAVNYLQLPLEEKLSDSILKLPYKLKDNEISIVFGIGYGWLAFDEKNHFIYSNDSIVRHLKEKIPKSYLKKNKEKYNLKEISINLDMKNRLIANLHSNKTLSFLKYKQDDFSFKSNRINSCIVSDLNTYSIYFIQNNKIKSYWYYAPKFAFENCNDETINKKMLKQFIELLKNWNIEL